MKKTTIKKVCFEYNKNNPSHHINGVIVDENGEPIEGETTEQ